MRTRTGFTLLELLVAVSVIGVLIAIMVPVLRSVAMRGHDAKNQTSLRSTHQHFRIYANDHEDYFVNAGKPVAEDHPIVVDFGPGSGWMAMHYLMQTWKWPAVTGLYYQEAFPTWHSTHDRARSGATGQPGGIGNPQYVYDTKFHYSQAMLADPYRFNAPGIWEDFTAFRRVRWSEVAFPASKGLMFDTARPQGGESLMMYNISFVDGSAGLHDLTRWPLSPGGDSWAGVPIIATPLGVLGRDVVR